MSASSLLPSETAESITTQSQSNFAASFFFLSPEKKQAIQAVYALSRKVDDAVDEAPSIEQAEGELRFWREELKKVYAGNSTHPLMQQLQSSVRRFEIPQRYFEELVDGVAKDLHPTQPKNFEELCAYTYGVASVVGLICMKIFEVEGKKAEQAAILLGRAVQITNILRDIAPDARMGRIYLPLEDLQRFGIQNEELLLGTFSDSLQQFLEFEIERAEAIYAEAFALMDDLPRKPLLAAWMMGKVYFQILKKIQKNPERSFKEKVKLSKGRKLRILFFEWLKSLGR